MLMIFISSANGIDIYRVEDSFNFELLGGKGYKIEAEITDIDEGKSIVLTGYIYGRGNPYSKTEKSDAEIYYTLDGSEPEDGTLYNGEIILDTPGVYNLRATTKEKFDEINEYSETIIVEEPEGEDNDKYYYNDDYIYKLTLTSQKSGHEAEITITSEPEGATIYYTLDGEDPTEDSEIYTEPFYLYEDTLIRVWATYKGSESDIMDFQLTFDEDNDDGDVYIECPYCEELFLESEDMYDEYGDVYCPYCDEYIFSRDDDEYEDEYYDGFETTSFDSTVSDWALEEIEEAYENDLIPETLIGRDLTYTIDREEFATIAVQLYETLTGESAESEYTPFDDIDYCDNAEEIEKAYGLGIVNGMTYDTFEPYMDITREQLATMLCRTIKKYSFEDWTLEDDDNYYLDTSGVAKFEDDNEISDYAKPSVYYMAKFGIIKGVDETHFAPKNSTEWQEAVGYATATREQALIMALRIFNISEMWQ